ncbi:MAG: hypothetical protein EOP05_01065 [Proteobacteria bacterium]|nr:MAG: hypothetical protein EOP05_01065 [Pseudomonadota bacterium]
MPPSLRALTFLIACTILAALTPLTAKATRYSPETFPAPNFPGLPGGLEKVFTPYEVPIPQQLVKAAREHAQAMCFDKIQSTRLIGTDGKVVSGLNVRKLLPISTSQFDYAHQAAPLSFPIQKFSRAESLYVLANALKTWENFRPKIKPFKFGIPKRNPFPIIDFIVVNPNRWHKAELYKREIQTLDAGDEIYALPARLKTFTDLITTASHTQSSFKSFAIQSAAAGGSFEALSNGESNSTAERLLQVSEVSRLLERSIRFAVNADASWGCERSDAIVGDFAFMLYRLEHKLPPFENAPHFTLAAVQESAQWMNSLSLLTYANDIELSKQWGLAFGSMGSSALAATARLMQEPIFFDLVYGNQIKRRFKDWSAYESLHSFLRDAGHGIVVKTEDLELSLVAVARTRRTPEFNQSMLELIDILATMRGSEPVNYVELADWMKYLRRTPEAKKVPTPDDFKAEAATLSDPIAEAKAQALVNSVHQVLNKLREIAPEMKEQ